MFATESGRLPGRLKSVQKDRFPAFALRCGDDGEWRHLDYIDELGHRDPQGVAPMLVHRHDHERGECQNDVELRPVISAG